MAVVAVADLLLRMGGISKPGQGIGRLIGRLVVSAVFSAVLLAALALSFLQVNNELDLRRKSLETTGYTLAASVADAVLEGNRSKAFESIGVVSRIPGLLMVTLADTNGTTLANLGQTVVLQSDLAKMNESNFSFLFRGTMPVAVDIVKGGRRIGQLVLLADISGARSDFLLTLIRTFVAALVAAFAGMFLSKPLQRRIVAPVVALTNQISAIRQNRNYSADIEVAENIGEVGLLLEAFKDLMADIRFRDQSLQRLAYFDALTGLPNRSSLLNEVATAGANAANATLAIIDVHSYKSFTNAFGQTLGDGILIAVATALRESAQGAAVFRVGVHDFAVLIYPDADPDIERAVAKLMAAFIKPLIIQRSEIKIDVDCGVATAAALAPEPVNGTNLMSCAFLAIEEARKQGPNRCVHYQQSMKEQAQFGTKLAQELRSAIANHTLDLHFQPQLEARSGQIVGFEALVRWEHPDFGTIPPSVFVPVAEASGLIAELGDLVLDESCRRAAHWFRTTGIDCTMSVNVSAAQFLESGYAAKVMSVADQHGLPRHLLCLEVTESIFIGSGLTDIQNTLYALSNSGIQLALDDFGTGYSSMGYLAKLPFSILKIDRSFVSGAHKSERRKAILKSIIDMSHSIGLDVVAEGAETSEEIALLKELRADKIQGYAVAKPMTADMALEFAAAHAQQGRFSSIA
jgi:diguanylate cyclase (GGDEF)-like protein